MDENSEERAIGPIEKHVRDQWDQIKGALNDGLSANFQLADLEAYLDRWEDEAKQGKLEKQQLEDYNMAVFVNDWNKENDLVYILEIRALNSQINKEFGGRLLDVSEDLGKFAIKTSLLAHGAIGLALIAAIFQNPSAETVAYVSFLLWFSLVGAVCSIISIAMVYYSYQFFGIKFVELSGNYIRKAAVEGLHKRYDKFDIWMRIFGDAPIFISIIAIFVQMSLALIMMPSLSIPPS